MTKEETLRLLIEYRTSLSSGRAKPDRNGNFAYIRDSVDYIYLINEIDQILRKELNINELIKAAKNDNTLQPMETEFK